MTDEIGSAATPDEDWIPEERPLTWGHPTSAALVSVALAFLCATAATATQGFFYVVPLAQVVGAVGSGRGVAVTSALLSVAFALVPLAVATMGLRLLVPRDPSWAGPVLRAAVAMSVLALALRLVGLISTIDSGTLDGTVPFFRYG